jgi:hypothetical protein
VVNGDTHLMLFNGCGPAAGAGLWLPARRNAHLLHGFGAGVKPPRRWQELARQKQQELDEQIARLKAMRRVVDRVMQCQCLELPECGRITASVMESAQ